MHSIVWQHDRCEIGYWILGRYEGKGYISEAATALTNTAFKMGFNRVELRCDPQNQRSANIPKRLGFTFEGKLSQEVRNINGEYRDTLVFARLKSQGML